MAEATWSRPEPTEVPPAKFTLVLNEAEAAAVADVLDSDEALDYRRENKVLYDVLDSLLDALDAANVKY